MNVFTMAVLALVLTFSTLPLRATGAHAAGRADRLTAQMQRDGTLRVIVGLKTAIQSSDQLSTAQAALAQRQQIAQRQHSLLQSLAGQRVAVTRQYRALAALALTTDAAGLAALRAAPDVASIEPDTLVRPALAESVPLIGAPQAWAAGYRGAGQAIAVLDSGIDRQHPMLAGKIVAEACYSDNLCPSGQTAQVGVSAAAPCTSFYDCDHGTHVAGIIAGRSATLSGVAPDASIIAVQVLSDRDQQLGANWSDLLQGLEYVYELRDSYQIAAVNISLASSDVYASASACDADYPEMKQAIDLLRSVGIATVIAAGNGGRSDGISAPACISSAVSVGATTKADELWSGSNSGSNLALLAPGVAINSCALGGTMMVMTGTSMAAPHVAGAWALLKAKAPTLSVTQALNVLRATGVPISAARSGTSTPRVRVDAAISALAANTVQRVGAARALYLPLVAR